MGAQTLSDQVTASIAPRSVNTVLMVAFAAMALLLAMVGICGVLTYAVAQRTSEIGLRVAPRRPSGEYPGVGPLRRRDVSSGRRAIGLVGSAALSRVISGLLYGVTPTDVLARVTVSLCC